MAGSPTCGKDIDRHALDGQHGAQGDGDQRHHHGERPAESGQDEAHFTWLASAMKGWRSPAAAAIAEQAAPHAQARQRVVDFRLRQQPLRLGHFIDVARGPA